MNLILRKASASLAQVESDRRAMRGLGSSMIIAMSTVESICALLPLAPSMYFRGKAPAAHPRTRYAARCYRTGFTRVEHTQEAEGTRELFQTWSE